MSLRRVVVERGGAPAAAAAEPKLGAGDAPQPPACGRRVPSRPGRASSCPGHACRQPASGPAQGTAFTAATNAAAASSLTSASR